VSRTKSTRAETAVHRSSAKCRQRMRVRARLWGTSPEIDIVLRTHAAAGPSTDDETDGLSLRRRCPVYNLFRERITPSAVTNTHARARSHLCLYIYIYLDERVPSSLPGKRDLFSAVYFVYKRVYATAVPPDFGRPSTRIYIYYFFSRVRCASPQTVPSTFCPYAFVVNNS